MVHKHGIINQAANLHRYVHSYNMQVLQTASHKRRQGHLGKEEGSDGCLTVATSLSLAHRLGFECQPANFKVPRFLRFLGNIAVTPQSAASGQMRVNCCTKTNEKEGSVGCDEELARAEAYCSKSHG